MDTALATTIISTSGAVLTGIFGMFFTANQLGKRMDDFGKRFDDMRGDFKDLRSEIKELRLEFYVFKDAVNGKLSVLDTRLPN